MKDGRVSGSLLCNRVMRLRLLVKDVLFEREGINELGTLVGATLPSGHRLT